MNFIEWLILGVIGLILGVIGLLIFGVVFALKEESNLEKRCEAQYNESKLQGKNLFDYQCAKKLGPQDKTMFMPRSLFLRDKRVFDSQ